MTASAWGAASPRPTLEALDGLRAAIEVLRNHRLPTVPESARMIEKLGADQIAPAKPKESILEEARRNLVAAAVGGFADVGRRDLREAPWLLWSEQNPLADLPGLLEAVHAMAMRFGSVRRKLIQAWLLGHAPNAPRIAEGGHAIRQLLSACEDARLDVWRAADGVFDVFDAHVGPRRLAGAILSSDQPVNAILSTAGLAEPLQAVGGCARSVQVEVLERIGAALTGQAADEALERFAAFMAPNGRLRFPDGRTRGALADGLLAPWLGGARRPAESVEAAVRNFILRHLGDPRLQPQHWMTASEEATALMRRWLGRASFKAFFDLIEELASDRQWRYRKAFWSSYLEGGYVDDIWIALGRTLHSGARAVKDLNGAYAELTGASHQAVLILQIRGLTLCEWSNVGKLRAWPLGNSAAPPLGRSSYDAWQFKGPSMPFDGDATHLRQGAGLSHFGGAFGSWQMKAAQFILRHTGIRLTSPSQWMPR